MTRIMTLFIYKMTRTNTARRIVRIVCLKRGVKFDEKKRENGENASQLVFINKTRTRIPYCTFESTVQYINACG